MLDLLMVVPRKRCLFYLPAIACLTDRLANPVVVAASGESCLHGVPYRHLDRPASRIPLKSNLFHNSRALHLQQSSSRMSWNAAARTLSDGFCQE
jgi:hypothetical protein